MRKKISILLLFCLTLVGIFYSKICYTAQYSVFKKNIRALGSAVYVIYKQTLIFDENSDALKDLINLAEQGNVKVQYCLRKVYDERHKVDKAVKWYSKAGAQKSEAKYQLGIMYVNAQGVEKSFENAIECYKAAQLGHADTMMRFARIYEKGEIIKKCTRSCTMES